MLRACKKRCNLKQPTSHEFVIIRITLLSHTLRCTACCAVAAAGVYGRVSELVRVTNRKYNLAMAVVMQRDLDSVVVEDRKAGFACIDYLKASK